MRRKLWASLVAVVATLASLGLVVASASADTPTAKFLKLTCDLNGQTTFSGWRGDPTDSVVAWVDAGGTFATAVFPGDLPAHPRTFSTDTPMGVLSDNNQPIAQAAVFLDYGTGTFPVGLFVSCS